MGCSNSIINITNPLVKTNTKPLIKSSAANFVGPIISGSPSSRNEIFQFLEHSKKERSSRTTFDSTTPKQTDLSSNGTSLLSQKGLENAGKEAKGFQISMRGCTSDLSTQNSADEECHSKKSILVKSRASKVSQFSTKRSISSFCIRTQKKKNRNIDLNKISHSPKQKINMGKFMNFNDLATAHAKKNLRNKNYKISSSIKTINRRPNNSQISQLTSSTERKISLNNFIVQSGSQTLRVRQPLQKRRFYLKKPTNLLATLNNKHEVVTKMTPSTMRNYISFSRAGSLAHIGGLQSRCSQIHLQMQMKSFISGPSNINSFKNKIDTLSSLDSSSDEDSLSSDSSSSSY